jgi:hypothetical protein
MKYMSTFFVYFILFSIGSELARAQVTNLKNNATNLTKYSSQEDTDLTLKTLTVAPAYDNVGGVYQTAAETVLSDLIRQDKSWAFSKFQWPKTVSKSNQRIDYIMENPKMVLDILSLTKSNGLMTAVITKSPQGININLTLFTQDKGLPLIEVSYQDATTFEISKFTEIVKNLYSQIKLKLPYKAFISSRRGNIVTINAGLNSGLKNNDKLSVAQIIQINRHPKLKFMVGVEKTIIGQIVLSKVEEYSSFGEILFEKETGVIEKNSKLLPPDFIQYQNANADKVTDNLADSEKNAVEWMPPAVPQFGKLTLLAGISDYKLSTVLQNSASYDSGNSTAPTFLLGADLWITNQYFARISLEQLFFKGANSLAGSSPGTLNYTVNTTNLMFGYQYALNGNFWGPSLSAALGYLSKSTKMTDTSPTAFSSFDVSGLEIQVGGYFPMSEKNDIGIGLEAHFFLTKNYSESPVDSGSSSPALTKFSVHGNYLYTSNINLKAALQFSSINSSFDGAGSRSNPARSTDEKISSYLFGIEYLF